MTGILSHETRAGATYDRGVIMPRMLGIMRHAMGTAGASIIHRRAQGLDKVIHINVILLKKCLFFHDFKMLLKSFDKTKYNKVTV